LLEGEEAVTQDLMDSPIRMPNVFKGLTGDGHREQDFAATMNLNQRGVSGWVDVQETPRGFQEPVDFLKGMDHALRLHSSE
jgi:hypothetical protein